jgi:hypothetical protein
MVPAMALSANRSTVAESRPAERVRSIPDASLISCLFSVAGSSLHDPTHPVGCSGATQPGMILGVQRPVGGEQA